MSTQTPHDELLQRYIARTLERLSDMPDAGLDTGEIWKISLAYCPKDRTLFAHSHALGFPSFFTCPHCGGNCVTIGADTYNALVRHKKRDLQ